MLFEKSQIDTLKYILENGQHPEILDAHPWANSLIVQELDLHSSNAAEKGRGLQLVTAIEAIFSLTMPKVAPRRRKRLDTIWGQFGIIAAQYFVPLHFGTTLPTSLKEAWAGIDQAILYFVYGKHESEISGAEKGVYKLVGDEYEVASNSTLSDWHRKGLQRLLKAILVREKYLSKVLSLPVIIGQAERIMPLKGGVSSDTSESEKIKLRTKKQRRRIAFIVVFLALFGIGFIGGLKVKKIYDLALLVRNDALLIQEIAAGSSSKMEQLEKFGPALKVLRKDFKRLKEETEPFLWLGPWMSRMPVYGGDLNSARELVEVADSLLLSVDQTYQALSPFLSVYDSGDLDPVEAVNILNHAQPELIEARQNLELAIAARSKLEEKDLSPLVNDIIVNDVDRVIPLLENGLKFAVEIPQLMGASKEGPKTYLLLAQNEDELRPTGGFITAASTILLKNGKLSNLKFVNSGDLDNWSKLYPAAPWQLNEYMNSPVLIFRDANWFTNYPTAALYAEYLYSYTNDHSVDGVIAFDQRLLIELLTVTGPIQLDDAPYPIGSDNIVQYMRESKLPDSEEALSQTWNNKAFLNKISYALLEKILAGEVEWSAASDVLISALNEHHLLLQFDNTEIAALLAQYNWDGSVQAGTGDFLMAVDTNIGFNKTNAVVESNVVYDVDLSDPSYPTGSLFISHKNNAGKRTVCKQWLRDHLPGESDYPITDCYWNYLRVYKPAGTLLTNSTPQMVPDLWMINKQKDPGQVNILMEEIENVDSFGTLQVVPSGESLSISFHFSLPTKILKKISENTSYLLKVQKQPGTLAVPFTLRIHLAKDQSIKSVSPGAIVEGNNILYKTDLRIDREFEILFSSP